MESLGTILAKARAGGFVNKSSCYGERDFWTFSRAGHAIISIQDEESDVRFAHHQTWNLSMQKMRAEVLGVKIVFGFFEKGDCKEVSQFGNELFVDPDAGSGYSLVSQPGLYPFDRGEDHPEYFMPINIFRRIDPDYTHIDDIVIGWGCEDLQVKIKTQLDFGQEKIYFPGDPDSIAEYHPEKRIFKRMSHTGRHNYLLKIDDSGLCTPLSTNHKENVEEKK